MRPHVLTLAAVTLVVLPALAAPVEAAGEKTLTWEYSVALDDSGSGLATVTMKFGGLKGIVDRMGFLTAGHAYTITDVASATSDLRPSRDGNGYELVVKSDSESFSFVVNVNRAAFKSGEYNAYVGPEWGVLKAEAFALGFNYSYTQGTPFKWQASLRYALPAGWKAEMPLQRGAGENAFVLPEGEVLPRGFVVVGEFTTKLHKAAGKEFRYANVGKALAYEGDAFPYLEKATPYYAQVYGPVAGDVILAIAAPSPMFRGGLGGTDSFYVHEESDLRTYAHEYAHVWQLFGTVTDPGRSSLWLNEGDADYHGALSLFVTDYWSLDEVNAFLGKYYDERAREPFRSAKLVDATYGGELEDVAYHKGALVLHALDALMRERTAGAGEIGVDALLRALNRAHDQRVDEDSSEARRARLSPVTNEEVVRTVNDAVAAAALVDFTPFFDEHVYGRSYPAFQKVVARDNLALTNITVTPARALPGDTITATIRLENRGIAPAAKRVPLFLDGELLGTRNVTVDVGGAADATFTFPAGATGDHHLRAFYLESSYRVLAPARLEIARVTTVPATLEALRPSEILVYVRNAGELEGEARVTATLDSFDALGERVATIPGNVTVALPFPVTFQASGEHAIELVLDGVAAARTVELTVLPADTDGDGARDPVDAYPSNARLAEKSVGNDVRNVVPGPGVALVAVALALVALARR